MLEIQYTHFFIVPGNSCSSIDRGTLWVFGKDYSHSGGLATHQSVPPKYTIAQPSPSRQDRLKTTLESNYIQHGSNAP